MNTIGWAVAAAAVGFGVIGVAAVGLWRRRPWAWPVSVVVQLVGTLGAIVAIATGGVQVPTILGLGLVTGGLLAVIAPATRRATKA